MDRLEALAGELLEGLREVKDSLREEREGIGEVKDSLQETRAIANSNEKSIRALRDSIAESKKQWERDRRGLYQLLGQLTRSMSDFYRVQSDYYNRFDQIEARQARMNEILDRYLPPDNPRA